MCKIYANWLSTKANFQSIGFTRFVLQPGSASVSPHGKTMKN